MNRKKDRIGFPDRAGREGNMEIQYVREFLSLAETESYFETAEQMFVTTSSLSRHIKALEGEIGVMLFDRTTRRVSLNRYGKMFLPYAREFVRTDDECTRAFAAERHDENNRIRIGSIPVMRAYRISDLLAEYQRSNKTTDLDVVEGDPLNLLPRLREGEIDFVFIRDNGMIPEDMESVPYTADHLCIVAPEGHPLAAHKSVSVSDLKNEPLLMIGKDAFMYKLCCDLCRKAVFEPEVRFTSHRAENLIDMVSRDMGVAMLMGRPASFFLTGNCRLIDVVPEIRTRISLVWMKKRELPPPHRKLVELTTRLQS